MRNSGLTVRPYTLIRDSYFSYGATFEPSFWSSFYHSHNIVQDAEGANDGLVSVASSRWGEYKGTLEGVSHLDLINWTNRVRWLAWQLMGHERKYADPTKRSTLRLVSLN